MTRKVKITGLPFKPELVRANKDGRKTVTRRGRGLQKINEEPGNWDFWRMHDGVAKFVEKHNATNEVYIKCPYGQKGDILYVKESYMEPVLFDGAEQDYYYAADYPNPKEAYLRDPHIGGKWKSGMFMPQSAARIWMEVVDSYPERIRDITREDAIAEGLIEWTPEGKPEEKYYGLTLADCWETNPVKTFERILVEINGQDMWDRNEWVWVIRYKILSTTGKPEGI